MFLKCNPLKSGESLGTSQRPGLQSKIVFVCNKRANKPLEPLRRYLNSQGFQIKAYGEREREGIFILLLCDPDKRMSYLVCISLIRTRILKLKGVELAPLSDWGWGGERGAHTGALDDEFSKEGSSLKHLRSAYLLYT